MTQLTDFLAELAALAEKAKGSPSAFAQFARVAWQNRADILALGKLATDLANEPPGGEVWERSRLFAEYSKRARQALEGGNQ